jgi:hypothetical protein
MTDNSTTTTSGSANGTGTATGTGHRNRGTHRQVPRASGGRHVPIAHRTGV